MTRYILKIPAKTKTPTKYFAGNIAKKKDKKLIITKSFVYSNLPEHAYIFTNKKQAESKLKELPNKKEWKLIVIK